MTEFERAVERLQASLEIDLEANEAFRAERDVVEAFYEDLEAGDVVWDVGAKDGCYTLFALDALGVDDVFAFEFRERLFPLLREHCRSAGYEGVQLASRPLGGTAEHDVVAEERTDVEPFELETAAEAVAAGTVERSPTVLRIDRLGLEPAILDGFSEEQLDELRAIYLPIYDDVVLEWLEDEGYEVEVLAERSPPSGDWHQYVRATPTPGLLQRGPLGELPVVPRLLRAVAVAALGLARFVALLVAGVVGRLLIGVVMVVVLVAFGVLALLLSSALGPLGVSEQTAAGAAGIVALGAFWFVGLKVLFGS